MGLILDTNVIILADRKETSVDFAAWSSWGDAYISVITASELPVGVHRANSEARLLRREIRYPTWPAETVAFPKT